MSPQPKPSCSSMSMRMPTPWTSWPRRWRSSASEQKLTFYNRAFVRLWGLPEEWLERHPRDGEILDRLRDARKLPEQRDYQSLEDARRLALYQASAPQQLRKNSGTFPAARLCGW